jgi:hypothetical protein
MNANQPVQDSGQDGRSQPEDRDKLVTVTVDGKAKEIGRGNYVVAKLKELFGVPADYELDEVRKGEFKPLDDNAHTHIEGREVFVSHVRRGGAS